jgi:hypothetical protein
MATILPASVEMVSLGDHPPGGSFQIVSNSLASPTVVTTVAPHGLQTGDTIFWTASAVSVPLLTATPQTAVIRLSATTFSLVGINCSTGGTSGAYDYAILSIPVTPGAAPLINCGRPHGLRVGDSVTFVATGSTPSLDGAQTVTAIDSPTAFRVLTNATPTTVAGSTTAAHYSKTTFYSDVIDRRSGSGGGALVITSLVGTAPNTCTANIQGSADGVNWFNIPYALVATPRTFVLTALTITTSTAVTYLLQELIFWRYLRVAMSASTNIKLSFTASVLPPPVALYR